MKIMETSDLEKKVDHGERRPSVAEVENIEGEIQGITVNASGHHDQLQRQYKTWDLIGLALTIGLYFEMMYNLPTHIIR